MAIKIIEKSNQIRGNPKCYHCGVDIRELFYKGEKVYSKSLGTTRSRYYCNKCKLDIFEGVKLRDDKNV